MATKKTNKDDGSALEIFAGVATAAIAGAFFLYGTKKGEKSRRQIKGWMLKAKGEVLEKIEKAQDFTEERYEQVVDTVMAKYAKLKDVEDKDLTPLIKEMKGHWKDIKKELTGGKKAVKKTAKKVTKKAVVAKKTVKKSPVAKKKTTAKKTGKKA